jgi:hypothetical protein
VYGRDSVDIVWRLAVGSALNESLPVNSTDRTRVLLRLLSVTRNDDVSADLALLAVERAIPIRRFFAWPGKRNYEGLWWSSTVCAHVPFESLLEREYLMWADFEPDIVAIAAQPLALLWPRGTTGHKNHVPDFFVRMSNGDGRLVDVRHPDCVEDAAAQFDLTRHVCAEVGWQRLGLGVHRVARSTGVSKDLVLANVLHLLWRRQLSANLSAPLSLDTEVSA